MPAFNEVDSLPVALEKCKALSDALGDVDLEVVVVDDGSTDSTALMLEAAVSTHTWLRVVSHPRTRGYGAALRSGFDVASGEVVAYTDADNQFDVMEFAHHLHFMNEADLVAGFRVYRFDPFPRLLASWIYNRLVRLLFRARVRDVDCSFKLMRRDLLDRLVLLSDDFFIDTELVARARKWNWRIEEVGVRHYQRAAGRTTVRMSDIPRTLRRVGQMWWAIYYPNRARYSAHRDQQDATRKELRGL